MSVVQATMHLMHLKLLLWRIENIYILDAHVTCTNILCGEKRRTNPFLDFKRDGLPFKQNLSDSGFAKN